MLSFASVATAAMKYKISANILPVGPVCFITGELKDYSQNPVYPGKVAFDCGGSGTITEVKTLPTGAYINNPPDCSSYTITASAPGKKSVSFPNQSVVAGQYFERSFQFGPDSSLADTISILQILNGGTVEPPLPADHNLDNRLGLPDVIFNLQDLAGTRDGGQASPSTVWRTTMDSGNRCRKVKLGKDTDGDRVDDWFREVDADDEGRVEIDELDEGEYSFSAFSEGNAYGLRIRHVKIAGRNVHLKTLRMKQTGSITGQVELGDATTPSDVQVYIPGISPVIMTDSVGNFSISGLPEGTYTLKAVKAGYGTVVMPGITVTVAADSSLDPFTLPAVIGNVSGTLTRENAAEHAGTLISLRAPDGSAHVAVTDINGAFAVNDLPEGPYTLTATYPGFEPVEQAVQIAAGTPAVVGAQMLTEILTRGTLLGTVTLQGMTEHIGILVSLAGTGYQAVTDTSGAFSISDIPAGSYTAFINTDGYVSQKVDNIAISTGVTETLDTELVPAAVAVETQQHGTIAGTAFFSGETIHAGIGVKVEGTTFNNLTDANGAFFFENVPSGTYTLTFTDSNHKTVQVPGVVVQPWDTAFVEEIQMIPKVGSISGSVELEDGATPSGVLVSVDGTSVQGVTGDDGNFLLEPLLEGSYTLRLNKDDYEETILTEVGVVAGQENELGIIVLKQIPEPPTGVTAVYLDNTSARVTWTESGSEDVSQYDVYYGTAVDQIGTKATTTPIIVQVAEDCTYVVTGLTVGTNYWFSVVAIDGDGLESPLPDTPANPPRIGDITGTVTVDGSTGLPGVSISVDGTSVTAVSAADGSFTLESLPAGIYTVRLSKTGYVEDTLADVAVVSGQTTALANPVVLQMETGTIAGEAYLEGATFDQHGDTAISLTGTTINTTTDAYGDFNLSAVPAGTYTVRAVKEGYLADEIAGFSVTPGQTNDLPRPLVLKKPPLPPTGVAVSQTTGSSATVSFTTSVSADLDTGGYNVYYGTSSASISTKGNVSLIPHPGPAEPASFEVTGLEKGVTYYFAVEAVDNDGLTSDSVPTDGSVKLTLVPTYESSVISGNYPFNFPFDIAVSGDGTKGYVSIRDNGCLYVIDLTASPPVVVEGGQINLSSTSSQRISLAYNDFKGHLYAVDENTNKLFVIDSSTDSIIQEVTVGSTPQNVIVSADGSTAYVCSNDDKVTAVDTTSYATESITLDGFGADDADPYGMAIANNTLYVVGTWTGKVYPVDIDSLSPTYHSVLLPLVSVGSVGGASYDAVSSEDGSYVYVSESSLEGQISIIATADNSLLTPIVVKEDGEATNKSPRGMVVSGDILYLVNYTDSSLTLVSTATNSKLEIDNALSSNGNGPEHIAASPDGSKLYIVHSAAGSVEVLGY